MAAHLSSREADRQKYSSKKEKKRKKKEYRIPTNGQGMIRLNVIRSKNMNDDEL